MASALKEFVKKSWIGKILRPSFRWRVKPKDASSLEWIREPASQSKWPDPHGVWEKHRTAYETLLKEQKGIRVQTHYAHEQVEMDAAQVISGVSSPSDGVRFLHAAVLRKKPSRVLEVGSAFGVASMHLAGGQQGISDARFLGIELDPWRRDIAQSFLDRMEYHWGQIFCGTLEQAIEQGVLLDEIDFCFIDAEHTKKACISYWDLLRPRLASGAVVVFDDIFWSADMRDFWNWMCVRDEVAEACEVDHRYGAVRVN